MTRWTVPVEAILLILSVILFYPLLLYLSYGLARLVTPAAPPTDPTHGVEANSDAPRVDREEQRCRRDAAQSDIVAFQFPPSHYGTAEPADSQPSVASVAVHTEFTRQPSPPPPSAPPLRVSRVYKALPRPTPVLVMLLTGVAVRAVLDSEMSWVRVLFGSWMTPQVSDRDDQRRAVVECAARRQAYFLGWLLWGTKPFMLMALATVAQNIGSHLSYAQLVHLRRPLTLFLCCFFTIVYLGMLLLFKCAASPLLGVQKRQTALEDGVSALLASSLHAAGKSSLRGGDGTALAADVHTSAEALLTYHAVYLQRTTWAFALVAASVTIERSSPEFLSAMQNTGVTSGLVPVFTLCVAACQDVFALFAFIVFSSIASSRQTDATLTLAAKVDALGYALQRLFSHTEAANTTTPFVSASSTATTARRLDAIIATRRSTGRQLVLIANATLGAVLTALLARRICFFVITGTQRRGSWLHRFSQSVTTSAPATANWNDSTCRGNTYRNDDSNNNDAGEEDAHAVSGSPLFSARRASTGKPLTTDQLAHTSTPYVLLIVIALVLVTWEMTTPSEVLLAAVFTGAAINFYTPCPYFEAGMVATQTLCNTVLFTTMGLRTTFKPHNTRTQGVDDDDSALSSSSSFPLVQAWHDAGLGPSAGVILVWGLGLFIARVFFCWLGGLIGGYAARLSTLHTKDSDVDDEEEAAVVVLDEAQVPESGAVVSEQTPCLDASGSTSSPSPLQPDVSRAATTKPSRASGVQWYIGLALLTQLAIALTLNQRGAEEYDGLVRDILPGADSAVVIGSTEPAAVVADNTTHFFFALKDVMVSMTPLTQAYMVAISCAMVAGPMLGAWYLRKVAILAAPAHAHHQ